MLLNRLKSGYDIYCMFDLMQDELRSISDRVLMRLHQDEMTARDVEDLLRFLKIFYYTMVEQMSEEQLAISRGGRAYSDEDARTWEEKFKGLLTAFDTGNRAMATLEAANFTIEGKTEFRQAELELRGMLSVSVEQLQRAAGSVRQRRGRSIGEVRDALRRHLHA